MNHYFTQLNASDEFVVTTNYVSSPLTDDCLKTLYGPLIGIECTGVYHFLSQFLEKYHQSSEPLTHYVILNELQMNLTHFEVIRKKLEAIGLLKSYIKLSEGAQQFVYKLVSPVLPAQFFNDPMLAIFLYQQVGPKRYQQLKERYISEPFDLSSYKDISSTYMDVFGTPKSPEPVLFERNDQLIKNNVSYGIPVHQQTFDFDMLEMLLQQNLITSEQLDKETRALIAQLSMLYDIGPVEMRPIILKSLTSSQTISHEDLRKNARDFYKIEHDGNLPQLKVQEQKKKEEEADSLLSWYEMMDTTSPIDMLSSLSNSEPTIKQKRMIESILAREKLPFGVMNILLQYVLFTNEMKLPQTYIEEIASNWKKLKLETSRQAYEYVKSFQKEQQVKQIKQQNKGGRQNRPVRTLEKTPEWLTKQNNKEQNIKTESQNKGNAEDNMDNDIDLEAEKRALQQALNQYWKEDKS